MTNTLGLIAFIGLMTGQAAGALFACMSPWQQVHDVDVAQADACASSADDRCDGAWLHAA
jgi:hypothetical protein